MQAPTAQERAIAERLIEDIDAIEFSRNLAVYERDARLIARWFIELAAAVVIPEEEKQ